jgi:hypothetical protein
MTMQHVTPFSTGGETTSGNLVAVCENCNAHFGNKHISDLYEMAALPYGCELALLNGKITQETLKIVDNLSGNLMHTRCEMY